MRVRAGGHSDVACGNPQIRGNCQTCGRLSSRVHDRYRRRVQDVACGGRPVEVVLEVRRFICGNLACPVSCGRPPSPTRYEQRFSRGRPHPPPGRGADQLRSFFMIQILAIQIVTERPYSYATSYTIATSPRPPQISQPVAVRYRDALTIWQALAERFPDQFRQHYTDRRGALRRRLQTLGDDDEVAVAAGLAGAGAGRRRSVRGLVTDSA
ncbi:transposase family protein [Nonomuraea endophytica]|uniref:transposase family protein n=1 Tax=Nonomuraea endophytica TaxID=714136 RepID=UPI0037CA19F4